MTRSDGHEPIEVELLPSDDASPFLSAGRALVASSVEGDTGPSRRGVFVPLVVGIIALGVGWVVGRGGAGTSPSVAPVASSTIAAADPVGSIAPAPTTEWGDSAREPAAATPATATGPAVAVVSETEVVVAPELRGQPIEVVAYGTGREVFQLDLTTSLLSSQQTSAPSFEGSRLLIGPTWALLPSNDADVSSTIVWDDGRTAAVDVGLTDQILGVADGRTLWWVIATDPRAGAMVQRRTVQGEFEQVIAGVPVMPSRVDPAGGVLLELPDGWFGVMPERAVTDPETGAARVVAPTVAPITSGRLLAISAEYALVEECGDDLACTRYVVDRAAGERRAIEPGVDTAPVRYALAGGSSVAPGGRVAVVAVLDPNDSAATQRSLGVVDLVTGEVDDTGPTQDVDQVAWTPDGRFLLFIAGGRVVAFDTQSMLTFVVADELVAIDAFGVRAAAA